MKFKSIKFSFRNCVFIQKEVFNKETYIININSPFDITSQKLSICFFAKVNVFEEEKIEGIF